MLQSAFYSIEELSTTFKEDHEKRQIARNGGKFEFLALTPTIQDLPGKGFDALKAHNYLQEKIGSPCHIERLI